MSILRTGFRTVVHRTHYQVPPNLLVPSGSKKAGFHVLILP